VSAEPLSLDLVVATLGRVEPLERLLLSLDHQSHGAFRVIVVDQNEDDRLASVLAAHPGLDVLHLRSAPGLSRARNAALPHLRADVVAWPDDDCFYPDALLEDVVRVLRERPELDGLTGQPADPFGRPVGRWDDVPCALTPENLWNRAISHTIFLRRALVEAVGPFDESLGLGSGTAWASGEEIDLLVRALRQGARLAYVPAVVVLHPAKPLAPAAERALALRDGGSVGYILGRHRYGPRVLGRMVVRPLGGAAAALVRRDPDRARLHLAVLRGRLRGYPAGRASARSSAKSAAWRSSHGPSA
jgi:glycosyltransferase involved in cell wall biosynthesis